MKSLIEEIADFVLGQKYYANVVNVAGTDRAEICSYIFSTREQAERHRRTVDATRSFDYIETITFRTRTKYH